MGGGVSCASRHSVPRPPKFMRAVAPDSSFQPLPLPTDPLLRRIAELEDAVRARDDFLAIAAHELRSPLNALSLRLAVLEQVAERSGATDLCEQIRRTRRSADRYARRAVVLLDISRLNAETVELVREAVDMRRLVEDVVESHADEAAARGTTLAAQVSADATGLWDPHMAEQIVSNLVTNAIKYGAGTPVTVRASVDGSQACFEVVDQGPGISAAQQARLFQKFERLVRGGNRSGYGLGLWIVARMVVAHKGTIDIESAEGKGTTFRVCLPLGPAALQTEPSP